MNEASRDIRCPYCGNAVLTDLAEQPWAGETCETLAVPLVARIGSATLTRWAGIAAYEEGLLAKALWLWNHTVGVLRYPGPKVRVMHREVVCQAPECGAAFDLFVTLSPNCSYPDIWPHLTGVPDGQQRYTPWQARLWFERFFDRLKIPPLAEAVLIVVLALGLAGASMLANLPGGGRLPAEWIETIILRGGSALLVAGMLISLRALAEHLRRSRPYLLDLLQIADLNGFAFWHNYMMARLTGVNLSKKPAASQETAPGAKRNLRVAISQATFLGGLPSLLILLLTWLFNYAPQVSGAWQAVLAELLFWAFVAFLTGATAWVSLNFSFFMTQNISFMPMKLTPLNGFGNIAPIRKMIMLTLAAFIPIVILPLFLVGAMLVPFAQEAVLRSWLVPWLVWALGLAFVFVGIADRISLVFGLIYIAFVAAISSPMGGSLDSANLLLIIFGLFFAILLAYQVNRAFSPIENRLAESKEAFLRTINNHLLVLSNNLRNIDQEAAYPKNDRQEGLLQEIERTLKIRDLAQGAKTSILNLPSIAGILSPLVSSLVIPVLLDAISGALARVINF